MKQANEYKTKRERAIDEDMQIVGAKLKLVEFRLGIITSEAYFGDVQEQLAILKKYLSEAQFALDIPDYLPSEEMSFVDD